MVNISNAIISWLNTYLDNKEITTDKISSESVSFGLFKAPTQTIRKDILGSQTNSDYYTFMCRLDNITDENMVSNQEFLQNLCDWIEVQDAEHNFPDLGDYEARSISVSSPFYMGQNEDLSAVYQMTIHIVYRKEI